MSKPTVLLADDDSAVLALYEAFLREHFDLLLARDGFEAWRKFQDHAPRLVVTDLNMPGINGQDLTEKIRNHETHGDTPVIIVTGTTVGSDLPPGFWRLGTKANQLLEKPVKLDTLLHEIRRQLALRAQSGEQTPVINYVRREE